MTEGEIMQAMDATWPPKDTQRLGPWLLRDGAGGGKRVSAATAEGPWAEGDIDRAEAAMGAPLFMIRQGDAALDAALDRRGYALIDPVVGYAAPLDAFDVPRFFTTFPHWPPLQIAREIWAEGHIGPARVAVMERVEGPKTVILSRASDRPTGVAFVAVHGRVAMLHAMEVSHAHRRQGSAQNILRAAAHWAQGTGADSLALVVTEANIAARALYASLGMKAVGQYHYRQK